MRTIHLLMGLLLIGLPQGFGQTILHPCKVVDNGGGTSGSSGFMLQASIGQPAIGAMSASGLLVEGGYLTCIHAHGAVSFFPIVAAAGSNGMITPSGTVSVPAGADQSFSIVPDPGYHIADVLVDSTSVGPVSAYLFAHVVANHTIMATFAADPGVIAGYITAGGNPLQGVTVKLLDDSSDVIVEIPPDTTDLQGFYAFSDLPSGENYQILLVEPLGYSVDANPKGGFVSPGDTTAVNFFLAEAVIANDARGIGYWRHQFDVYVLDRGSAQETEQQLIEYIAGVHEHYTPHFTILEDLTTFEQWQSALKYPKSASLLDKAKTQLAALVLNLVSLKIGQYAVVTADGRNTGDGLTFVSAGIEDGLTSNDALSKDVAEQINNHELINAGVVPEGAILYKGGRRITWTFDVPESFALLQNYPNPFNPTTTLRYDLPVAGHVLLEVYNITGQRVSVLVNEHKDPGRYTVSLDAGNMASGIYLYRIITAGYVSTRKMILLK